MLFLYNPFYYLGGLWMTNYRNAETADEISNFALKLTSASVDERSLFTRFMNKQLSDQEFLDLNCFPLLIKLGYLIPNVPSTKALIGSYADFGITTEPLKGGCWHSSTMVAVNHDGVQYALDDKGSYFADNDKKTITMIINNYQLMSGHYHNRIKEVYDHLKTKTTDDIWVMVSGASSLQAFFGNKDGYLAILYLDKADYIKIDSKDQTKIDHINTVRYTLNVQFSHNNHYFENAPFKNLKIQYSQS